MLKTFNYEKIRATAEHTSIGGLRLMERAIRKDAVPVMSVLPSDGGRPLRVLNVVTQMNKGGLETRLMELYRSIDKEKLQFDFLTCREEKGYFDNEIIASGGKVEYGKPVTLGSVRSESRDISRYLHAHPEYKIIHCHINQWSGFVLKGAYDAGVPVRIAHSRATYGSRGIKDKVRNIVKQNVNQYATHKFAVSAEAGRWLFGEQAMRNGEVETIPNAIDCRKYQYDVSTRESVRKTLGLDGDDVAVMNVANFYRVKNHAFLIDVFKDCLSICPSAKLFLVGDGSLRSEIEQHMRDIGIAGNVSLLGLRSDVSDLLQAADVYVCPSFREGFPGSVLEAEAAGLPCLISDSVTNEVCILPSAQALSLSQPHDRWAQRIIDMAHMERRDTCPQIVDAGYDTKALADKITQFYYRVQEDAAFRFADCS